MGPHFFDMFEDLGVSTRAEWYYSRYPPLLPTFVDFTLEHFDVIWSKVCEATLSHEVVFHGFPLTDSTGDGLGCSVEY